MNRAGPCIRIPKTDLFGTWVRYIISEVAGSLNEPEQWNIWNKRLSEEISTNTSNGEYD